MDNELPVERERLTKFIKDLYSLVNLVFRSKTNDIATLQAIEVAMMIDLEKDYSIFDMASFCRRSNMLKEGYAIQKFVRKYNRQLEPFSIVKYFNVYTMVKINDILVTPLMVENVCDKLLEKNLPTNNLVVEYAIRQNCNDKLDQFIDKLETIEDELANKYNKEPHFTKTLERKAK